MSDFNEVQRKALAYTPKCTSIISIPCSLLIIMTCVSSHRKGKGTAIQRCLIGMCTIDMFASSAWFISSWAVPVGTHELARGNRASCNYQGFLLQLAIGAPMYNGLLALYYLLIIKFNWKENQLKNIEKYCHSVILIFAIGTSIAGLVTDMYNPLGNVCWVISVPENCGSIDPIANAIIPCERGQGAFLFGILLFYGPVWLIVLFVICSMIAIYIYVQKILHRLDRYAGVSSRNSVISDPYGTASTADMIPYHASTRALQQQQKPDNNNQNNDNHGKKFATQAILYSLSFIVTWLPSTIWSVAHWCGYHYFWLDYAAAFCEPLQGFWNCLIFFHKADQKTKSQMRSSIKSGRRVSKSKNALPMIESAPPICRSPESLPQNELSRPYLSTHSAEQIIQIAEREDDTTTTQSQFFSAKDILNCSGQEEEEKEATPSQKVKVTAEENETFENEQEETEGNNSQISRSDQY